MKNNYNINIGTSGWVYKHWKNVFYAETISERDYLKFYSKYFSTTEVNNSFYHLLNEKSVKNWINSVPENFIFSIKASRYITHMKKLLEPEKTTLQFFESIKPFQDKIGPILFQLPPKLNFSAERLKTFVKSLPKEYKYTFEFRDSRWFNSETYDILNKHNIALCIYNLGPNQSPKELTADFVYIRLHGNYGLGSGKYSESEIHKIAKDIKEYTRQNKDVYCYFNNDEAGYAIENARLLKQELNLF